MRMWLSLAACTALPQAAFAQCAPAAPACNAPPACQQPCYREAGNRPESGPREEGYYVRSPESGEFSGPAESVGVRGFGIRLPEIRLDFPEVRLPHLVRYRRNPEMIVESSRAPYVRGPASEFNQVAPEPESAPRTTDPESDPRPPYQCVPPAPPCTTSARERKLQEQLARREAEIEDLNQRFGRLEALLGRLADQQAVAPSAQQPILPSSFEDEESSELPEAAPAAKSWRSTNQPAAAPVRRQPTVQDVQQLPPTAPPNVGHSRIVEEPAPTTGTKRFGDWNNSQRKPASTKVDTRQVRR